MGQLIFGVIGESLGSHWGVNRFQSQGRDKTMGQDYRLGWRRGRWRWLWWGLVSWGLTLVLGGWLAFPAQAHWGDLSAAEVRVEKSEVQMTLTYPTAWTGFADGDRNGHLDAREIQQYQPQLQEFFQDRIRLRDSENRLGQLGRALKEKPGMPLAVQALSADQIPTSGRTAPKTHSHVLLTYSWPQSLRGLQIHYNLFPKDVPSATCLMTVFQQGRIQAKVLSPKNPDLAIVSQDFEWGLRGMVVAIAGAFVWGAVHSLSPGHGKSLVGAYLVGDRATAIHACFLALTTTVTHTLGVFALGGMTLFAAQYILPEQIYPWLSLVSGGMVTAIGVNLLRQRWGKMIHSRSGHSHLDHSHSSHHFPVNHPTHSHTTVSANGQGYSPYWTLATPVAQNNVHHNTHPNHTHPSHNHFGLDCGPVKQVGEHQAQTERTQVEMESSSDFQTHGHIHHGSSSEPDHSHLPPTDWRSLIALGISGGLVPCPAALVLLLSAIALGKTGFGLVLVLTFSLGLACVLTALGLVLVHAKQYFQQLPQGVPLRVLPTLSALGISVIGGGIVFRAVLQLFHTIQA